MKYAMVLLFFLTGQSDPSSYEVVYGYANADACHAAQNSSITKGNGTVMTGCYPETFIKNYLKQIGKE